MSKRHDKDQPEEQRELTLKEQRLRHRDRERHKKLFTFVGIAIGLALALVVVGVAYQFLVFPNTAAAKVGDVSITTRSSGTACGSKRARWRSQLNRYTQLEQQFGNQGYFQSQIDQLQNTLASPYALGNQTLDGMIEDIVVAKEAATRGITVCDEEVDQALREEVANCQGLVTESQAQATATDGVAATATAAPWTPTPTARWTPTCDYHDDACGHANRTPAAAVITETTYTEGLANLEKSLAADSGLTIRTTGRSSAAACCARSSPTRSVKRRSPTPRSRCTRATFCCPLSPSRHPRPARR